MVKRSRNEDPSAGLAQHLEAAADSLNGDGRHALKVRSNLLQTQLCGARQRIHTSENCPTVFKTSKPNVQNAILWHSQALTAVKAAIDCGDEQYEVQKALVSGGALAALARLLNSEAESVSVAAADALLSLTQHSPAVMDRCSHSSYVYCFARILSLEAYVSRKHLTARNGSRSE